MPTGRQERLGAGQIASSKRNNGPSHGPRGGMARREVWFASAMGFAANRLRANDPCRRSSALQEE